jgi:acyl-CoA reductase-like NAD-dependent aldehyde dehydrogenase
MASRAWRVAVLLLVPALATAQSLGEAAAREKAKRDSKRGKSAPAPSFTDADLKDPSKPDKKDGEGTASSAGQPGGGTLYGQTAPETAADAANAAPSVKAEDEPVWRQRVRDRREAVSRAEKAIEDAQSRLNALMLDRDPTNLGDPSRLQTLEVKRNEARSALEGARLNLAEAQKGLQDLEEEARRNGVPPGWLR